MTAPAAALVTVHTDADPCPRVEIVVSHMPPGADEITVYRSWQGRRAVVRGASRAEVSGPFLVTDYEVPLGTPVSYSTVTYTAAGVPSQESDATTVTVDVSDAWIQDPLDPTGAMQAGLRVPRPLMVADPSFAGATYALPVSLSPIVGSADDVAMTGTRRSASRMPLTLDATTSATTLALRELLEQSPILCIRTPVSMVPMLSGLTYVVVESFVPQPDPGWTGGTLFAMTADAVRGPGAAIVVSPRTYADLLAEAGTYADLLALYPTYLDMLRGP